MKILKTIAFLCCGTAAFAQNSPLDKLLTARFTNERVENIVEQIGQKADIRFSYSPNVFDGNRRVSIQATAKPVRQVLDELFKQTVVYKERRGYIILLKAPDAPAKPKDLIINGYVFDRETGKRLAQVSIFERQTLASAVSNEAGYYRLKLPIALSNPRLEVRKVEYWGETIILNGRNSLDIGMRQLGTDKKLQTIDNQNINTNIPRPDSSKVRVDIPVFVASTDSLLSPKKPTLNERWQNVEKTFVDGFASAKQAINVSNVQDTLYRPIQVSLMPFLGTNHILSGNVINSLSINLIAGYSRGVYGLEVGNFLNLVRQDVRGAQFSGFANMVGRHVSGVQAAGFLNATRYDVSGVQAAGFVNVAGRDFRGLQVSGFANLTGRHFKSGLQIASFINIALGQSSGMQLSGFANVAGHKLRGAQIASVFNYAKTHQRGLQLALFNYADSLAGGLPIGLVSFVRKNGYRRLEISTDELNYANLTFKTGVARFYNIFTAGFNFNANHKPLVSFGYGIGKAWRLGKGWMVNLDGTGHAIIPNSSWLLTEQTPQLYRLSASVEKKLGRHVALAAGPSVNWLISSTDLFNTDMSKIYEINAVRTSQNGRFVRNWLGFQAALRFL